MYDSSMGKAVRTVVCRGGDLLVCQRVDEFRYSDADHRRKKP